MPRSPAEPVGRGPRGRVGILTAVRRGLPLLLCALCALAGTASVAAAQDDEVFVDPGSPSGKEYALPIDEARQQGAAKQKPKPSAERAKPPLFGEGVEPKRAGTTTPQAAPERRDAGSRDDAKRAKARAADNRRAKAAAREKAAAEAAARAAEEVARTRALRAQAASPDGGVGFAAMIGAGVGVLLIGGLAGLLLRRRAAQ